MKNTIFSLATDEYYQQDKNFLIHLVSDNVIRVLDIGCGSGAMGKKLLNLGKAREVYGVEIFEPAAQEARKYYHEVHVGDIEDLNLPYVNYFDLIVFGDILEHLIDPLRVLNNSRNWLKEEGSILCCVPNIRYWKIAYKLIVKGDWEYENEGIMDHTHLRFFTTRSLKRLLVNAGYVVENEDMRIAVGTKQRLLHRITFGWLKEYLGYQIMICARKQRS